VRSRRDDNHRCGADSVRRRRGSRAAAGNRARRRGSRGAHDRIASLRYALEGVTIACWLLGTARGGEDELAALHGSRLAFFCTQAIDTTVRGLIYEAAGCVDRAILDAGADLLIAKAAYSEIPLRVIDSDPADSALWVAQARTAIAELLDSGHQLESEKETP
jgi:hypothetical protein